MTKFEVGKIYQNALYGNQKYKCLGVYDDYPVMRYVSDSVHAKPFVSIITSYEWKEYVEPKLPVMVERWVNVYKRSTDGAIKTSEPFLSEQAAKEAASFTRLSQHIGTIHIKETFDAP